ncbi:MAG: PepSY domain-containing protein [Proteobacteria bacterium]|nr:PepSY domain-containing protein [Pseudomonadota bacterium]
MAFFAITAGGAASAQTVEHDKVRCEPMAKEEMKPQMDLQRKLTSEGWKVRQVKNFNGCYEVYGFDASGKRVEAFFNPKTFDKVGEVKQPE